MPLVTIPEVLGAMSLSSQFTVNDPNAVPPVTPNRVGFSDISNWATIGLTTGNNYLFDAIVKVVDPVGLVIYENAGWAINDYSSPDFTITQPDVAAVAMALDSTNKPIAGLYTLYVKMKVTNPTEDPQWSITVSKTFQYTLCGNVVKLKVCIKTNVDCDTAKLQAEDTTHYVCDDYPNVQIQTRTITIYPPQGLNLTPATSSTNVCTYSNLLSPATYDIKLTAVVEYQTADHITSVAVYYEGYLQEPVACDDQLCKLYCCLKDLERKFCSLSNKPTQQAEIGKIMFLGSFYYEMAVRARKCGTKHLVQHFIDEFYHHTHCDPNCNCCNDGTPAPVIPAGDCNCQDGQPGAQLLFQIVTDPISGNLIIQTKYENDPAWTTQGTIPIADIITTATNAATTAATTAVLAALPTQVLSIINNHETFKIIGGGGFFANNQPVPNFEPGAYGPTPATCLRVRKRTDGLIEIMGIVEITNTHDWSTLPIANIVQLPVGYKTTYDSFVDSKAGIWDDGNVIPVQVMLGTDGMLKVLLSGAVIPTGRSSFTFHLLVSPDI